LDTLTLATYYAKGLLTAVHLPTRAQEKDRDLIRSRGFVVHQQQRLKVHVLALCQRTGIHYREAMGSPGAQHWNQRHVQFLQKIAKEDSTFGVNLGLLIEQIQEMQAVIEKYDHQIAVLSEQAPYQQAVHALTCFRGIACHTAMVLCCEFGDLSRFSHPRQMVSWSGLDIKESSSGGKEKKFGITHMGNRFVRTALVEACQTAKRPPQIHKQLAERRKQASPEMIQVAQRCMQRLYKKSNHLLRRGKHPNQVKVACAREMIGFVWESLRLAA